MGTEAPGPDQREGAAAVIQHRPRLAAGDRVLVAVPFLRREGRGIQIGDRLVKQRPVPGFRHVFRDGPGQPQQIVAAAGPHPAGAAAQLVPPVLHVARRVLVGTAAQELRPGRGGVQQDQVHRVLKLVPEAEGSAVLVQGAAPQQTAGEDLIRQPAVGEAVQRRRGAFQTQPSQQGGPV